MMEEAGKPIHVTDGSFKDLVNRHPLIIIDCWAEWCYPCRMIVPVIDSLAAEYEGKAVFGKLNVDENPATSEEYEVMSIPTLLVFKNGKLVDRIVGAAPKQIIEHRILSFIG